MFEMHQQHNELKAIAEDEATTVIEKLKNKAESEAIMQKIKTNIELHQVHQESWILNSRPAQQLSF